MAISDSATPIASADTKVSQNDVKRPMSAAANAGTTSSVSSGLSAAEGARKIAASPARTTPAAQLAAAITSGDQPSAEVASWFSATADEARPKRVCE